MRKFAEQILVAGLVASLLSLPGSAATSSSTSGAKSNSNPKPLGLVIQSQSAMLDNSEAAIGTTVFAGDALETQAGGMLRLRVGSSQLYLLGASAATLVQSTAVPQAHILRGTVGLSTIAPSPLELDTPLGIVRAEKGGAAYGQVRIVSPEEIVLTSFHGNLTIDYEGDTHTIESGKSYDVTFEAATPQDSSFVSADNGKKRRRIVTAIVAGAMVLTGYFVWQEWSESCYGFNGC